MGDERTFSEVSVSILSLQSCEVIPFTIAIRGPQPQLPSTQWDHLVITSSGSTKWAFSPWKALELLPHLKKVTKSKEVGQEWKRELLGWTRSFIFVVLYFALKLKRERQVDMDISSLSPSHSSRWASPTCKGLTAENGEKQSFRLESQRQTQPFFTLLTVCSGIPKRKNAPYSQFDASESPFLHSTSASWVPPVVKALQIHT